MSLAPDADLAGNGTDNAPALQALLGSGRAGALPPGRYKVCSTLRRDPADGDDIGGTFGGSLGPDDTTRGTWLVWGGPDGGTALDLRGIKCRVRDLGIVSATNTSLDRAIDVETPDSYPNISSQHLFERVAVEGRFGPVRRGWVVGEDQRGNNEFHTWRGCTTRQCSYAGIHVPNGTSQSKNNHCEGCTFEGSGQFGDYGVAVNTGSFDFTGCNFDSLGAWANWWGGAYEPCTFLRCRGENNRRAVGARNVDYVNLVGCRLHLGKAVSRPAPGEEFLAGGNNWAVSGCRVEADPGNPVEAWFRPGDDAPVTISSVQFPAWPLADDGQTTWRGHFANVRVGNDLLPDGTYYQRYVPGCLGAGSRLVLWDGRYPPKLVMWGGQCFGVEGGLSLTWDDGKRQLVAERWDAAAGRLVAAVVAQL